MVYRLENICLEAFAFYDSELSLVSWDESKLVISAESLNIHKEYAPDSNGFDMEIGKALLSFCGFRLLKFIPAPEYAQNEKGEYYQVEPSPEYDGETAHKMLSDRLKAAFVAQFAKCSEGVYELYGSTEFFGIAFEFDSLTAEWDGYNGRAWYEKCRDSEQEITLATPVGDKKYPVSVICSESEEKCLRSVTVRYNGETYTGRGKYPDYEDAFADLQKNLPVGVVIKCCLTCKYGNFCPIGNEQGEIFCLEGTGEPKDKSDILRYTADDGYERRTRKRRYCDFCEKYKEQAENYLTYNSYLLCLKNDRK
ncbi:MAG: hypothetical protein J6Q72_02285 [Clostridia bacterium]|nr:hypothetical protein [Clostridia bacterium]